MIVDTSACAFLLNVWNQRFTHFSWKIEHFRTVLLNNVTSRYVHTSCHKCNHLSGVRCFGNCTWGLTGAQRASISSKDTFIGSSYISLEDYYYSYWIIFNSLKVESRQKMRYFFVNVYFLGRAQGYLFIYITYPLSLAVIGPVTDSESPVR